MTILYNNSIIKLFSSQKEIQLKITGKIHKISLIIYIRTTNYYFM